VGTSLGRALIALPVPAVALVLGTAVPAAAHVTLEASTTTPGAETVVRLSFDHGCDGSPTTALAIRVPEGVEVLDVPPNPLWQVEQADGAPVVFRADTAVPDGQRGVVELRVRLPETPGAQLAFATVQTCEQGEHAWLEQTSDDTTLDLPAPVLTLAGGTQEAALVDGDGTGIGALAIGVVGVGVLGAVAAGGLTARRRRRS
jgi:periplasmic copper chaperone A